ncbi:hypothetical protein LINPERHAP2_LOCUS20037 [Linum perenne]
MASAFFFFFSLAFLLLFSSSQKWQQPLFHQRYQRKRRRRTVTTWTARTAGTDGATTKADLPRGRAAEKVRTSDTDLETAVTSKRRMAVETWLRRSRGRWRNLIRDGTTARRRHH